MSGEDATYPIIDDVGSYPLPKYTNKKLFYELYWDTHKAFLKDIDIWQNRPVNKYVIKPIIDSFRSKIRTGLEVINYPQHIDMYSQFLKPIENYETDPMVIDPNKSYLIEMKIIEKAAKRFYEEFGKKLKVKACVSGAMELYMKKNGFSVYKDMAMNFARSVNNYLKKSIIKNKYMETTVLSVDEPSIGLITFNGVDNNDITDIIERSVEGLDVDVQIHLHSLNAYQLVLEVPDINILTCEYASNQKNVIPKRDLDVHDKYIRVGVSRTNVGTMIAEEIDRGMDSREFERKKGLLEIIDLKDRIQNRYKEALDRYGDRLKYVGPDCGLKSWNYQFVAEKLLSRTVTAIKELR